VPHLRPSSALVVAMATKHALETVADGYAGAAALPLDCVHVWGRAVVQHLQSSGRPHTLSVAQVSITVS
jgi:hypothetical protein